MVVFVFRRVSLKPRNEIYIYHEGEHLLAPTTFRGFELENHVGLDRRGVKLGVRRSQLNDTGGPVCVQRPVGCSCKAGSRQQTIITT